MLERNFPRFLCLFLALFVLAGFSLVHSAHYALEAKAEFTRSPQLGSLNELPKLFTYKARLTPENDYTSRSFGESTNIFVSALEDERQQYMEVITRGIKWMAIVHKGRVTSLHHIANDTSVNSGLVDAGLSLAPQMSSPIVSLMKRVYRKCLDLHGWSIRSNWVKHDRLGHMFYFL